MGVKRKIGFILIGVGFLVFMAVFSWATQQQLDAQHAQPNDPVPAQHAQPNDSVADYSLFNIIISSMVIVGVIFLIWGTLGSKTQRTIPNLIILVIVAVLVLGLVNTLMGLF